MKIKTNKRGTDEEAFELLKDDEAESFGEEFVASITSGEFIGEDARDEVAEDELGVTTIVQVNEEDEEEEE